MAGTARPAGKVPGKLPGKAGAPGVPTGTPGAEPQGRWVSIKTKGGKVVRVFLKRRNDGKYVPRRETPPGLEETLAERHRAREARPFHHEVVTDPKGREIHVDAYVNAYRRFEREDSAKYNIRVWDPKQGPGVVGRLDDTESARDRASLQKKLDRIRRLIHRGE